MFWVVTGLVVAGLALVWSRVARSRVERYPIAAFFEQPDEDLLLLSIGESIGEWNRRAREGQQRGALPPAAGVLSLTNWAEYRVGNGGFAYFFEFAEHEAEATLAALQAIGADQAVAALRSALSMFPGSWPHDDWQQRMDFLAAMSSEARQQFEAGAHTFYDLTPLQARFARAHQAELATLPPVVDCLPPQPLPAMTAPSRRVARWLCSHGVGVEFKPLRPWASRWSVRNGTTWKPAWRSLAGIHVVDGSRDPAALVAALARLRAAAGVVRAVISGDFAEHHVVPLLSSLASLPNLRELELRVETLSPELVQALQEVRRLRHLRIVAQGVTHDVAKLLVGGRRPRHAELTCPKAAPPVRTILSAGGWVVAP